MVMGAAEEKRYSESLARVRNAIEHKPVDRIPFLAGGPAFYPHYQGVKLCDYLNDMELNCTVNIKAALDLNADGTQAQIFSPDTFPTLWFSTPKIPGRELSDDELWQIDEKEMITHEDYDYILENGWIEWREKFVAKNFPQCAEGARKFFEYIPTSIERTRAAGIPTIVENNLTGPFEHLCGGRTLAAFLMDDIMEIPEKLEQVFEVIAREEMAEFEEYFKTSKPLGTWVGGWRGTPSMLNREMFLDFSWKYLKAIGELAIEYDVIPMFHLDSNWDAGLDVFNELEPNKAIIALDGKTNIYKAKEICGDNVCIMGDVPAEMLAFGKPGDVYNYSVKLIREIGPTGFILCSGCDTPFNANVDNVFEMKKAVEDTAGTLYSSELGLAGNI